MDLENKFYFKWNFTVIIITVTTTLLLLGSAYGIITEGPGQIWLRVIIGLSFFVAPLVFCALNTPLYIKIDNENVIIKKVLGYVVIKRTDILSECKIERTLITDSYRKFGSGGLFGFLGKFYNSKIGNYNMYATETKNLISISTFKRRYVISCNNPILLLKILRQPISN